MILIILLAVLVPEKPPGPAPCRITVEPWGFQLKGFASQAVSGKIQIFRETPREVLCPVSHSLSNQLPLPV